LGHGVGLDMEERELLADRTLSEPQWPSEFSISVWFWANMRLIVESQRS
jgi:hypothetical protein